MSVLLDSELLRKVIKVHQMHSLGLQGFPASNPYWAITSTSNGLCNSSFRPRNFFAICNLSDNTIIFNAPYISWSIAWDLLKHSLLFSPGSILIRIQRISSKADFFAPKCPEILPVNSHSYICKLLPLLSKQHPTWLQLLCLCLICNLLSALLKLQVIQLWVYL